MLFNYLSHMKLRWTSLFPKKTETHQSFYIEDMDEYELFNHCEKIIDSVTEENQYDSTLRYIKLYYNKTENFVLYNTLLRKLNNKKPLLN